MRAKRPVVLLMVLVLLGVQATAGALERVLCRHADGTSALETGTDSCCREQLRADQPSPAAAALDRADGDCPGCEDRVLSSDSRSETRRTPPLLLASPAIPRLAPERGAGQLLLHRIGRLRSRGAPPPRPLRV